MMQSVGLRLKTIVSTSNPDPNSAEKLSSKVLGCLFDIKSDFLGIKFTFNPSKKKKGLKTHPDLTLSDVNKFHESSHSRRALLSLVNGIYDPIGIASPYTIKLKLLMKQTIAEQESNDWDSPVPDNIIKDWISVIKEGILVDSLYFPCSTVSSKAVKKPRLVGFWDGSSQAFSGAIYVVSMISKAEDHLEDELQDGDLEDNDYNEDIHQFEVHLLAAKARVTPLKTGLTIPRAELSGLLVCTRLMAKAVSLFPGGFS